MLNVKCIKVGVFFNEMLFASEIEMNVKYQTRNIYIMQWRGEAGSCSVHGNGWPGLVCL